MRTEKVSEDPSIATRILRSQIARLHLLSSSERRPTERSGTVVLHVPPIDAIVAADIAVDNAEDNIQRRGIGHSTHRTRWMQ